MYICQQVLDAKSIIKAYLSFRFHLIMDIFDKAYFEAMKLIYDWEMKLKILVYQWFQWEIKKFSDEEFIMQIKIYNQTFNFGGKFLNYDQLLSIQKKQEEMEKFVDNYLPEQSMFYMNRFRLMEKEILDDTYIVKLYTKSFEKLRIMEKINENRKKRKKR
jgi:hypothetical protein